jgi:hypothetical protein
MAGFSAVIVRLDISPRNGFPLAFTQIWGQRMSPKSARWVWENDVRQIEQCRRNDAP